MRAPQQIFLSKRARDLPALCTADGLVDPHCFCECVEREKSRGLSNGLCAASPVLCVLRSAAGTLELYCSLISRTTHVSVGVMEAADAGTCVPA